MRIKVYFKSINYFNFSSSIELYLYFYAVYFNIVLKFTSVNKLTYSSYTISSVVNFCYVFYSSKDIISILWYLNFTNYVFLKIVSWVILISFLLFYNFSYILIIFHLSIGTIGKVNFYSSILFLFILSQQVVYFILSRPRSSIFRYTFLFILI